MPNKSVEEVVTSSHKDNLQIVFVGPQACGKSLAKMMVLVMLQEADIKIVSNKEHSIVVDSNSLIQTIKKP